MQINFALKCVYKKDELVSQLVIYAYCDEKFTSHTYFALELKCVYKKMN